MDPLVFLDQEEFRTYNVEMSRNVGSIHAAILLSELIQRYRFHKKNKDILLKEDGAEWFYYTAEKGVERLGMTEKEQRTAIKLLEGRGLISKAVKGIPAKRYFSLHIEKI